MLSALHTPESWFRNAQASRFLPAPYCRTGGTLPSSTSVFILRLLEMDAIRCEQRALFPAEPPCLPTFKLSTQLYSLELSLVSSFPPFIPRGLCVAYLGPECLSLSNAPASASPIVFRTICPCRTAWFIDCFSSSLTSLCVHYPL